MGPNPTSDVSEGYILRQAVELYKFDSADTLDLARAKLVSDFTPIVSRVLGRFDKKFGFVLGSNFAGSRIPKDIVAQDRACELLSNVHQVVPFYDLAFEHDAKRLRRKVYHNDTERFTTAIRNEFYRLILRHPNLGTVVLMPGWQNFSDALSLREAIPITKKVKFLDAALHFRNLYS